MGPSALSICPIVQSFLFCCLMGKWLELASGWKGSNVLTRNLLYIHRNLALGLRQSRRMKEVFSNSFELKVSRAATNRSSSRLHMSSATTRMSSSVTMLESSANDRDGLDEPVRFGVDVRKATCDVDPVRWSGSGRSLSGMCKRKSPALSLIVSTVGRGYACNYHLAAACSPLSEQSFTALLMSFT